MLRLAFVLMLAAGCAWGAGDPVKGKELFKGCAGCHNTDNDARKMGPSLRTLFGKVTLVNGKHVDDADVREIIYDGFNGMPSLGYTFRPAEMDDLMAYLHTLNAKPTPAAAASPGETYFRAYCVRCHNPDSRSAEAPDLRGRFQPEWKALIEEGHAKAPPLTQWLDDKSRQQLLDFLKSY